MASILTPEDVVRRIAAECTLINERGAVGIRLKPAAAIVRQYGERFRQPDGIEHTIFGGALAAFDPSAAVRFRQARVGPRARCARSPT